MHQHSPGHVPRQHTGGHHGPQEQREQRAQGLLSQSDPEPARRSRRPPIWLIVIVVVLLAVMLMHGVGH